VFPYVSPPVFVVLGRDVHAFWLTTVAAVVTGFAVCIWRARRTGFSLAEAASLTAWIIVLGLVGAHVIDVALYHPRWLLDDPAKLLDLNAGLSSFGGMLSGVGTALFLLWRRGRLDRALAYVDAVAFGFPFAWLFGRLGCALVHDHMGVRSDAIFAVRFPDGPRLDLGLLELLLTIPLALAFAWLVRRPRPAGFFLAWFFVLYSPVRFALDFFRAYDATYLGLTPGQYLSLVGLAAGVALLRRLGSAVDPVDPPSY
jgi:phosphatidylglycerol:prolipoprotein diacylglycerol transferase